MNSLFVGLAAAFVFLTGYKLYGKCIQKLWDIDLFCPAPARQQEDGVDYRLKSYAKINCSKIWWQQCSRPAED